MMADRHSVCSRHGIQRSSAIGVLADPGPVPAGRLSDGVVVEAVLAALYGVQAAANLGHDPLLAMAREALAELGIRRSTLQLEESHRHGVPPARSSGTGPVRGGGPPGPIGLPSTRA